MNVFSIEKIKDLPWGWLIGVFVVYGASGYFIGGSSAPWQTGAAAGAVTGAVTGAAAGVVAVAWAGTVAGALVGIVLLEDFIFDRWKNTAWFENIKLSIFFVLPALSASTMLGIVSQNILLGIGTGVGSNIIFFAQFFTTDSLYKKKLLPSIVFGFWFSPI